MKDHITIKQAGFEATMAKPRFAECLLVSLSLSQQMGKNADSRKGQARLMSPSFLRVLGSPLPSL